MGGILSDLFPAIYVTATGDSDFNTAMSGCIFQEISETASGTPLSSYPYAGINMCIYIPGYIITPKDSFA